MPQHPRRSIAPVSTPEEIAVLRSLLEEYWNSFGFTPCFQGFAEEVAALPGHYAPPQGRLAIAWVGNEAAGCVALRPVDARRAEAKRLFVRPAFRGLGLGRGLVDWIIAEARSAGYTEIVGDSMPVMKDALDLYKRLGFESIPPYSDQATSSAIPLRLKL